jgi:hypothetical protein
MVLLRTSRPGRSPTYLADLLPRLPTYSAKRVLELSPAAWRVERLGLDG